MRKVLGYVWLKPLFPLKYESVQTAFVPKAHADAGFFLLMQAAELSREWQIEIVAFDHVDHRAAFRAMKLQGVSLFSMALIAAIWSGSCMKARLGTVTSNKVQMSRGLPQGAPESQVIFTMITELVRRDLIKSWISRKLAWRLDDFTLAAICLCGRCGVDCCIGVCCVRSDRKTERGWTDCWCRENTLDEFSEDDGPKHHGKWIGCGVGSMVCFDGNARHAIAHRTAQANKCRAKWKLVLNSQWLPRLLRFEHRKDYDVAGLPLEFECLDDGQGYRETKIASWSARMVANVVGVKRPPGMELGQW